MDTLKYIAIPAVIFSYGLLFLHLGFAVMVLRKKRRIHIVSSRLILDFACMCIFGSYTVYNNLSSVMMNSLVFVNLVLIAPLGLDFLIEIFAVRIKWTRALNITKIVTFFVILSSILLFYSNAQTNIVYSFGYAWLTIVFCCFLIIESVALFPFSTMPKVLRIFYILLCYDVILVICMLLVQLSGYISLMFPFWFLLIISLIISIMIVFRYPESFSAIEDVVSVRRYEKSKISILNENTLITRLEELMNQNKMYLEPELRLADISKELNITSHQLSELINTKYSMTFNNYINTYRIDHACKLLSTKHEFTILQIAYESGFNSKSAFNTVFKATTGKTPTSFYKEVFISNDAGS